MKPFSIICALLLFSYPFAVYYGLNNWGLKTIAGVLGFLFLMRFISADKARSKELKYIAWLSASAGIVLTFFALIFKNTQWFTYYPVIVNILMLILFAQSLYQKESLIERFARLQKPNLPVYAIAYTRNVTKVWWCILCG